MIKLISILSLCFFIGGCCSFKTISKKCECKEVYAELEKYAAAYLDTITLKKQPIIKNPQKIGYIGIQKDIQNYLIRHQKCWIGLPKQFVIDLLGTPNIFQGQEGSQYKGKKVAEYRIHMTSADGFIVYEWRQDIIVNVLFKKNLNEKITRVRGGYTYYIE